MGTATLVPLQEYLHTSYEHDCEWVDGVVKERGMPDGYHAFFQKFFLLYFEVRVRELGLNALSELRIRAGARNYRIPDVTVLPRSATFLTMPTEAPTVCIEILSPDDKASDLNEKIEDYVALGVKAIWIVDPRRRTMATADAEGIHSVTVFRVPDSDKVLSKAELFAELDAIEGSL